MAGNRRAQGGWSIWNHFAQQAAFIIDCQVVISFRLLKLAAGGPAATSEATRMVGEKLSTFADAQRAAAGAWHSGGIAAATCAAQRSYRKRVSANRRRLST